MGIIFVGIITLAVIAILYHVQSNKIIADEKAKELPPKPVKTKE